MLLEGWWPGGGTDYGGCAGRHAALTGDNYNLCGATMHYDPDFVPVLGLEKIDEESRRWGIFGRVNFATSFAEVRDGTANTLMIGELQRVTTLTPGSRDGWAMGGPTTLFTTGALVAIDTTGPGPTLRAVGRGGKLLNNMFYGSPGSDHAGGAHFGLADCGVRWFGDEMDPNIFALLGSMADDYSLDGAGPRPGDEPVF
jgi:hypothetical protein